MSRPQTSANKRRQHHRAGQKTANKATLTKSKEQLIVKLDYSGFRTETESQHHVLLDRQFLHLTNKTSPVMATGQRCHSDMQQTTDYRDRQHVCIDTCIEVVRCGAPLFVPCGARAPVHLSHLQIKACLAVQLIKACLVLPFHTTVVEDAHAVALNSDWSVFFNCLRCAHR